MVIMSDTFICVRRGGVRRSIIARMNNMAITTWLESWWATFSVWEAFKTCTPIGVSVVALLIVLNDRRPRLQLRAKKGDWYTLKTDMRRGHLIFQGIVEVYNVSARANAVHSYWFYARKKGEGWKALESEQYINQTSISDKVEIFNQTPLTLAPYSGLEVPVQALTEYDDHAEVDILIETEDIFKRRYSITVKAS